VSGLSLGDLHGLNFLLRRAEGDWEFTFTTEDEVSPLHQSTEKVDAKNHLFCFSFLSIQAKKWYNEFKNIVDAWQLQELCNEKLERSKGVAVCTCPTVTLSLDCTFHQQRYLEFVA